VRSCSIVVLIFCCSGMRSTAGECGKREAGSGKREARSVKRVRKKKRPSRERGPAANRWVLWSAHALVHHARTRRSVSPKGEPHGHGRQIKVSANEFIGRRSWLRCEDGRSIIGSGRACQGFDSYHRDARGKQTTLVTLAINKLRCYPLPAPRFSAVRQTTRTVRMAVELSRRP